MKMKTLENVSDKDLEYTIAEAEVDSNGNLILDDNGRYKETSLTNIWKIKSGETLAFPEYVANILLDRYGVEDKDAGRCLLREVVNEVPIEQASSQEVTGFICKKCGKSFTGAKGLALHLAGKHPDLLK